NVNLSTCNINAHSSTVKNTVDYVGVLKEIENVNPSTYRINAQSSSSTNSDNGVEGLKEVHCLI
ncbi:hypothetical protein BgiMline_004608, partial [Biomphalaria glabrata]